MLSLITSHRINTPHGFFTREGGVSDGIYASLNCGPGSNDTPEHVQGNRARVTQHFDKDATLLSLYQIHSADVITVTEPWDMASPPKADGMVTNQPNIVLGILTADCGPVLFHDPVANVIGAAHAGWKGAVSGVLENTISAMQELGANKDNICTAIGPCIAQASYEVGPEFYQTVCEKNTLYGTFFIESKQPEHFHFDLEGFIHHRLQQAGIAKIDQLSLDTYVDEERFFSYRRTTHHAEKDYGRQISAIMLEDGKIA